MALGKLWQAFFGKRTDAGASPETGSKTDSAPVPKDLPESCRGPREKAVAEPPLRPQVAQVGASATPTSDDRSKRPRRNTQRRGAERSPSAGVGRTPMELATPEPLPPTDRRPTQPKRNAWTTWVAGRSIRSILDTQPGNGGRAVPLLEAIVCRSSPDTRYIAIGSFELADPSLSIRGFHKTVRQVGGIPVPIPGDLISGLRHVAQTHGTVDLILLEQAAEPLTNPEVVRWLDRVSHADTLVLQSTPTGKWEAVTRTRFATPLPVNGGRLTAKSDQAATSGPSRETRNNRRAA